MWIRARKKRGSALLSVLWLSAALATIAFSLANTVRGETERTSTEVDSLRAYYVATGAVERAALELLWSVQNPAKRAIPAGSTAIEYRFPTGDAHVEFIPETAKLNVNFTKPEELNRLLLALGIDPLRAEQITLGIVAARTPVPGLNPFAQNLSPSGPSFHAFQSSFQEIEELLLVPGVTPDLFYGTYVPVEDPGNGPRLARRSGLVDCLSVFGATQQVDANTADAAVLAAVGLNPLAVMQLVQRRRMAPFTEMSFRDFLKTIGVPGDRLRLEGNTMVTIRATARPRLASGQLSDLKRTVAALVKYMPPGYDSPIHILRWHDTAWSN